MFNQRTVKPSNNLYYIRKDTGGYNEAILGKPTDPTANVLRNCVGYANGRFGEIQRLGYIKYQFICPAGQFIKKAKAFGLEVTKEPTLGGIMVWSKSGESGHVAVVEQILDDNNIYTSESGWKAAKPFYYKKRTNNNKRWGQTILYDYLGCIRNPSVEKGEKGTEYMFEVNAIKRGSKGKDVTLCQKLLYASGYTGKNGKPLEIDGSFGANTEYAINQFQTAMRKKGIECGTNGKNDGSCGKMCWKYLLDI